MTVRVVTNILVSNKTFIIPYLISLCTGTLAMSFWNKEELFYGLHNMHTPSADIFLKYFTHIGDGLFALAIIILMAFVHFGKTVFLLCSFMLSGLISQVLKKIIFADVLRPKGWFGSESSLQAIEGLDLHTLHSFPSGHTVTAFSTCLALAIMTKNKTWGYLLVLIAILVGYSRIYIGQHFFEDVYYGSLIGVVCTIFTGALFHHQMDKPWARKSLLRLKK